MKEKELERLTNLKKVEEELYNEKGLKAIAGIDEAGRGPLAGPVVVACALMPKTSMIEGVNDEINILQATKKGLTTAIKDMEAKLAKKPELEITKPDAILVDALTKIDTDGIPYKSIIHGDAISYSIACASIIAKVTRDRIMRQWDEIYPQYGFAKHKGYGTAAHIKG